MGSQVINSICNSYSLMYIRSEKKPFVKVAIRSSMETKFTTTQYRKIKGSSWPWMYSNWIYNYLCNQCLSPLILWVRIAIRTRCTTLCDKVCQWLATGRWFSPGPPVSSTNETDRHDIAEILLKLSINTIKQTNKQKDKQMRKTKPMKRRG